MCRKDKEACSVCGIHIEMQLQRGPPKHFFATVTLRGTPYGEGEGRSKKQAEQAAARAAWQRLQDEAGLQDEPAFASSSAGEGDDA